MIAGISSILEDKNRKPSGPTNQSQQMPMSSGPPSQSQLSQTPDAAASGIVEVITPSGKRYLCIRVTAISPTQTCHLGANKVNTTNLSVQEVQKLKADVDATVTSLAQRLRSNVTQGKMSQDYAKKLYNGIAEKATKQGALLDAVIASKGGPSSNPVTKSSPFVPPQQAQPQPQTKQQQQQPQATMPPVSRSQPQPSVSQPSLQPSNPGQTLVWTGPLVHYSFDPATGQRKDIVTMIEIFPSSRAPLSELTAVAWPQRLEFNKTFPLNGPALQQYVTR